MSEGCQANDQGHAAPSSGKAAMGRSRNLECSISLHSLVTVFIEYEERSKAFVSAIRAMRWENSIWREAQTEKGVVENGTDYPVSRAVLNRKALSQRRRVG